ncbi:gliding motility lipoprotein GldB [Winogradskyella sp.]|jgi:gliding motility-associated lipoprotein GldB|uniref:gliding motility lipoprotein GldB n=1 Tax=Winogradskyella sp. TaxID=1883156 RepID=UPI0025CD8364|nr:gliding motility lipoprotein GldB [Winogradskyella sp.]MCT4628927.1 gliding motility lipoprotein GldB [Winogradskyella sp.]
MTLRIIILSILGLFFVSCNEDSKLENEISNIDLDFVVERFDKIEYAASPKDLPKLKETFPFLFSKKIHDSVWVNRLEDTLQNEILTEVNKAFNDFKEAETDLTRLFKHLKYYDKVFSVPRVVTLTNYVQYRDNVIVTDSIVLIALDNYLGSNHKFYVDGGIPAYISSNMKSSQIICDIAEAYAEKYTFQTNRSTLLDEMIYYGKLLYFKDVMIPFKSDAERIGYTDQELKWAEANESPIWSHFIEKEMLYSTDSKLPSRFIADAPFSKFYLQLDNESPGRLGQYIGWQIVKAYAKATDEDVMTILEKEPEEIFKKAKFKPRK